MPTAESKECAWCGAEILGRPYPNRRGETFCSRSHREASNAALRRLQAKEQTDDHR